MSRHTNYRSEIVFAANLHGLKPNLLEALVIQESGGKAHASRFEPAFWDRYLKNTEEYGHMLPERAARSYGLTQIMFSTARELGFRAEPEMLFLPNLNLDYGGKYLSKLLRWANGDEAMALAAYNGGQGNWTAKAPQIYAGSVLHFKAALDMEDDRLGAMVDGAQQS